MSEAARQVLLAALSQPLDQISFDEVRRLTEQLSTLQQQQQPGESAEVAEERKQQLCDGQVDVDGLAAQVRASTISTEATGAASVAAAPPAAAATAAAAASSSSAPSAASGSSLDGYVRGVNAFLTQLVKDPWTSPKRGLPPTEASTGQELIASRADDVKSVANKKKFAGLPEGHEDGYIEMELTHVQRVVPVCQALYDFTNYGMKASRNTTHFGKKSTMRVVFMGAIQEGDLDQPSIYGTVAWSTSIKTMLDWYRTSICGGDEPHMYLQSKHSYDYERSYTVLITNKKYDTEEMEWEEVPCTPAEEEELPHLVEFVPATHSFMFRPCVRDWPTSRHTGRYTADPYMFLNLAFELDEVTRIPQDVYNDAEYRFVGKKESLDAFPQDNDMTAEDAMLATVLAADLFGIPLPPSLQGLQLTALQRYRDEMYKRSWKHMLTTENLSPDKQHLVTPWASLQTFLGLAALHANPHRRMKKIFRRMKQQQGRRMELYDTVRLGNGRDVALWKWQELEALFEHWKASESAIDGSHFGINVGDGPADSERFADVVPYITRVNDDKYDAFSNQQNDLIQYAWLVATISPDAKIKEAWRQLLCLLERIRRNSSRSSSSK